MDARTLGEHLARLPFRVQRQFRRLSEDEKRTVAGEFARHVRNCRSIDCNIDPQWLPGGDPGREERVAGR